jgi:hypothetical protein
MRITSIKHKKIIASMAAVVFVAVNGVYYYQANHTDKPAVLSSTTTIRQQAPTTYLAYQGQTGRNALEILKEEAVAQTKQSSYGEFVTSINGNDGGGKQYWILYVNGVESSVGAGSYVTQGTDKIEWKLM